jgi:hypothetical protein
MALSTLEAPMERPPLDVVIPNFREDERIVARYESMLQRRKKTFAMEHENAIRRNASTKRDDLREELERAQAEHEKCSEVFETAREAYRAAFPDHVKKTRLVEPTMIENVRSLGAARKLYTAAHEAWLATERAMSSIRRLEHNESQLEIELQRAVERAPQVIREVTESEKWLAEIHAEEELGSVKAKVDEIVAEREAYAKRLADGGVTPEEVRLRAFALQGIKHITVPASGLLFLRVEQYGTAAYFILRDLRKQLYALPYDRRLEPLLDGVYDIEKAGDGVAARRSLRENGATQLTAREHFMKCNDNKDDVAQPEYQAHREFIKQSRMLATASECDETEATATAALAALATAA